MISVFKGLKNETDRKSIMIVVVDYGMGNLRSVEKALKKLGKDCVISGKEEDFAEATHIILPGVGFFKEGMANLKSRGIDKVLEREVIEKKKPLLGICLGMQLLLKTGQEGGNNNGLGFIDGDVMRFSFIGKGLKIPHVGWNNVMNVSQMEIFNGIPENTDFYFVHSYHAKLNEKIIHAETDYGYNFPSAINKGNIFGVQFHPEKSQKYGILLLKNFCELGDKNA